GVLGAVALVARGGGRAGLGLYALMLTAAWLAGTVLSLGLPAYNASFVSSVPAGVLLANSLAWNAGAAAILAALCIPALALPGVPLTWKVMIIGILMSPLLSRLECTRGIFQGLSAMSPYNWLGLSSGALNLGGVGLLLAASRLTLWSAIACWIAATFLTALAAIWLGLRHAVGLRGVDAR